MFIYGWNQYLWPLIITSKKEYYTVLIGLNQMIAVFDNAQEWHIIMATTILAMLPPLVVVIGMQRLFVKGLTETEK
jgi:sn-glycerol 3-phosphate transport system permease protein